MSRGDLTLELSPATLVGLRPQLDAWLRTTGVAPAVRDDILLAAWEAAVNAVEHGRGSARLTAEFQGEHVMMAVSDEGSWSERGTKVGERGHGLRIIVNTMDRVRVVETERGTTVLMCRCLTGSH